jgi:hypothetical protein
MQEPFKVPDEKAMSALNSAMKLFVVEYSLTENATMIRTLEKVLMDNISNVRNGQPKDYLPVGIYNSRKDAERVRAQFLLIIVPEGESEFRSRNWKRISECLEEALERSLNRELNKDN